MDYFRYETQVLAPGVLRCSYNTAIQQGPWTAAFATLEQPEAHIPYNVYKTL